MEINIGSIVKIKKGHQDNRGYDDFFKECDKYEHLFIVTRMSIYDDIRIITKLSAEYNEDTITSNNSGNIVMLEKHLELIEITREDLIKHVENMQKRWINESIQ